MIAAAGAQRLILAEGSVSVEEERWMRGGIVKGAPRLDPDRMLRTLWEFDS